MNFFKLYIGDYQRDTGSLSLAEHGAYLLMLQHYYATERPLPEGRDLFRLLRATNKAEKDAILKICAMFWSKTPDGLVNERAWSEIQKGIHQREVNQSLGMRGGRPKRTESVTESVSIGEPNENPNQTPDTRELSNDNSSPPTPPAKDDLFEQAWSLYPRRNGSNPKQPALIAWRARIKAGFSPHEILAGVTRYAYWCASTGKIGSENVMQAKRFFGVNAEFKNDWEIPIGEARNATHQRPDNSAPGKIARAIADRNARKPAGSGYAADNVIELGPADYRAGAH